MSTQVFAVPQTDLLPFDKVAKTTMGRTETLANGAVRFAYPGVTFQLKVKAKSLTINVQSNTGNSFLDVQIDTQTIKTLSIPAEATNIVLFEEPVAQIHTIRIVNRGETWHGINQINGLTMIEGELLSPEPLPARKILLLGDSVTCAEAIDRVAGQTKAPLWWNALASYGMLAAEGVNAQIHLVCYGGRGLVRSWNGVTDDLNLADFYSLTLAIDSAAPMWDAKQYQADLVISAIGTNDFSQGIPAEDWYVPAYIKFVQQIRVDYPQATIALMPGSILHGDKKQALLSYIKQTVGQLADTKVVAFSSEYHPGDDTDAHPTKIQHQLMADELIRQVEALMQW